MNENGHEDRTFYKPVRSSKKPNAADNCEICQQLSCHKPALPGFIQVCNAFA